jgi:surface polysaccharide O-acyltransferase-like enzyme
MAVVIALVKPVALGEHLQAWALSLYSGNATILKQATGMSLLWFLPSFISLVALRSALEHAGTAGKVAALVLICVAHLFIGTVAARLQNWLPLGLLPALYVIPLGYLGAWLQRRAFGRMRPVLALALAIAVFVPVKYLQMRAHLYNEVGFAVVADYTRPYALLLNDLECVTGVLMLFQLCRFGAPAFIEACGRYSIQIYLFHAFIALAVYKAVLHLPAGAGAQFIISMAATVFLSLALARWLAANPLAQRFVFPRSPAALLGLGRAAGPLARPVAGGLVPQAPSHPDLRR